jgi:hypothetical protein
MMSELFEDEEGFSIHDEVSGTTLFYAGKDNGRLRLQLYSDDGYEHFTTKEIKLIIKGLKNLSNKTVLK